jgi:hypothetical protein
MESNIQPPAAEPLPSQVELNKVIRRLNGEKLKFTITIYTKSGRVYEVQANAQPTTQFDDKLRKVVLVVCGYDQTTDFMIDWDNVEFVATEKNP